MISEKIKSLIQSQDPHAGMDQLFFTNSEVFHASYDAIIKKQWYLLRMIFLKLLKWVIILR